MRTGRLSHSALHLRQLTCPAEHRALAAGRACLTAASKTRGAQTEPVLSSLQQEVVLSLRSVLKARASQFPTLLLYTGGCLAAETCFCHFSHQLTVTSANLMMTGLG